MPKISIIVSIYNVERFLSQCVDSILAQTLKEIEIILVNDGSQDGCPQIMDAYAKRDSRIVVVHQENGGYGRAMNHGLSLAHGEYIGIVEPDDWIEATMFETLYTSAKENDVEVVKARCYHYEGKTNKNILDRGMPQELLGGVVEPIHSPKAFKVGPTIWTAIYKRSFLNEHSIHFLETPGASYQDAGFHFKVMFMANRVCFVDRPLYHYRIDNEGSSVKNPQKVFCVCDEWKDIIRYLKEKNLYKPHEALVCALQYDTYRWNWKRLTFALKKNFFEIIAEEFKTYQQTGVLTPELIGKKKYKQISQLIRSPRLFAFKYEICHLPKKLIRFFRG